MAGPFVVEGEPDALVSDVDQASFDPVPRDRHLGGRWLDWRLDVGGGEGVTRQQVECVHQDEFLVLLFVVDAELD